MFQITEDQVSLMHICVDNGGFSITVPRTTDDPALIEQLRSVNTQADDLVDEDCLINVGAVLFNGRTYRSFVATQLGKDMFSDAQPAGSPAPSIQ